jgi:hypothetical protein
VPTTSSFGHSGRYYSEANTRSRRDAGLFDAPRVNADVRAVFKRHQVLHEIVERTVNRWNDHLRKLIRDETGLKFVGGNERQGIKTQIVDGLPLPLASVFEQDSNPLLWELILNNSNLQGALSGLDVVAENFDLLSDWRREHNTALTRDELQNTKVLITGLIDWLKSRGLKERIQNIDEDVLGAYFFHKRNIQIYWMAISVAARMLNVSIEGLTIAVFAHELIHAYTHLGNDHDGEQWATPAFADADNQIVEGLAQFYTAEVCKRIEARAPGSVQAFEQLSTIQSPAYNCFRSWTDEKERGGEIVRFSMIGCRKRKLTGYKEFLAEIRKVRERVGHQPLQ